MHRPTFAVAALLAPLALSFAPAFAADAPAAETGSGTAATASPAPAKPATATPAPATPAPELKEVEVADSILKLVIETQAPDISHPWAPTKSNTSIATGVSIKAGDKTFVLVSATSIAYATRIEAGDGTLFSVAFAAPTAQLALLSTKDAAQSATFFKNHPGLELTEYPATVQFAGFGQADKEAVAISGLVGETRTDGAGLVSYVSLQQFRPQTAFGPALSNGKLAGLFLSAQLSEDKKNANASFIPAPELKVFLDDVKDGRYDGKWGFKTAKVSYRPLTNPALRAKLGIKPETEGLLIDGEAAEIAPLQPNDILVKIGQVAVDNEGLAQIGGAKGFRGSAFYHLNGQVKADAKTLPVTVLRDGKAVELEVPVMRRGGELMPSLVEKSSPPRYFVFGPLCFEQVSAELAQALAQRRGLELMLSGNPIAAHLNDNIRSSPDQELVVLSNLFPHAITKGYSIGGFPAVKSVNGKAVTSLRQLAQLLADAKDEYVEVDFFDRNAENLVFKRAEMQEAAKEIRKNNGIVDVCSEDLKDIVK